MNLLYLILLLIVVVITALVLQKISSTQEGFVDSTTQQLPILNTCPHRMNSFIEGATYCCDGAVTGNQCQGRKVCAMSPGVTDISSCAQYLYDYTKLMNKKHCFGPMPYYYEDESQIPTISGCASQVNGNYSAPGPNTTSCKIYPNQKDNQYKSDSCENQQMVNTAKTGSFCKTVNCSGVTVGGNGSNILWINASYMTQDGSVPIQATCETKESVIRHITHGYGDYHATSPDMQAKTGEELANALAKVNNGIYPGMCADATMVCKKKATYIMVKGGGYIQISQIVAKDMKGNNVARGSVVDASPPWGPESKKDSVVDGTEATRAYPNIYHSKSNDDDTAIFIKLSAPACVSEIILYGRSDGFQERHADKTIMLLGGNNGNTRLWSAKTNIDLVQTFTIPANTFA